MSPSVHVLLLLCALSLFLSQRVGATKQTFAEIFNSPNIAPQFETYANGTARLSVTGCCSGGIMRTTKQYQYGRFSARIRLHSGFSAGIVSTFYLFSFNKYWDEIDIEFLGSTQSRNIIFHTNYITQGVGGKEEQFKLWFDPGKDYHNYTIHWTPKHIAWLIDGKLLRLVERPSYAPSNAPGFVKLPMTVYATTWDGSSWVTYGGAVRADYTKVPFNYYYASTDFDACLYESKICTDSSYQKSASWNYGISTALRNQMAEFRRKYLVFSYLNP